MLNYSHIQLDIDTTKKEELSLTLQDNGQTLAHKTLPTRYNQAEILLPQIIQLLKDNNKQLPDIKKIVVQNGAGSFTSLRIGIATANALAYALDIKVEDDQGHKLLINNLQIVEPRYDREPNITLRK